MRNRPLFRATRAERGGFAVRAIPHDAGRCKILARAAAGVTRETLCELLREGGESMKVFVSVVNTPVAASCIANLPEGVLIGRGVYTRLAALARPLAIFVINTQSKDALARAAYDRLRQQIPERAEREEKRRFKYAFTQAGAKTVLEVDPEGVIISIRGGEARTPRIWSEDIEKVFPLALEEVALFECV
jgi:hypothetical protein